MRTKVLLAVFLGGGLGSALRYLVFLAVETTSFSEPEIALMATAIVNLSGALFLGIVQSEGFSKDSIRLAFFSTGLAGGFTTMSGLMLVTQSENLGPFGNGTLFWLAVILQLILGVLAYWIGRIVGGKVFNPDLKAGKS